LFITPRVTGLFNDCYILLWVCKPTTSTNKIKDMKYRKNQKDLRGKKKDKAVQKNTEKKVRQESKRECK